MSTHTTILRIAVPTPLRRSFDYLPPLGAGIDALQPGIRVRVPFGRRSTIGVLLAVVEETSVPSHRLKHASELLDTHPVLPPNLMALLSWASQYYQHPIGDVMRHALPNLLRQGHKPHIKGIQSWSLSEQGQAIEVASLTRAPKQAALLACLQSCAKTVTAQELDARLENWRPTLARLVEKGWVNVEEKPCLPASSAPRIPSPPLNHDQQQAVTAIADSLHQYARFLLDGVTGSGKTEVYLHVIERVIQARRQAMVLVPEIALTPQLVQRFHERLACPIAVLHSGLSDQERLCAWLAAGDGSAPVVIGTRSALFTPMKAAGVFIIDEEHDASFKQQDGFRYSARDLAMVRAQKAGVPVILGSATPSLESIYNARQQRYHTLRLGQRAGAAEPPRFRILDVRSQTLDHNLSAQLLEAMKQHLAAQGQVILFLNRRGYAPVLMCHNCGWHAKCNRCDAHMTVHYRDHRLRCHHCGAERRMPDHCPECHSHNMHQLGVGTERVEQALKQHFPDRKVLRMDRDSTRRKGALQSILDDIHAGHADILLGTQMLAKGHHFPNVTLVGLLDADHGLYSVDFRASERMGQLILQVAGRAGRAERPGEVIIQTHYPDNPLLHRLINHDYQAYAADLLQEREASALPPFSHLALLRAEAANADAPVAFLNQARSLAEQHKCAGVDLLGPVPAPMERRAGRLRAQILVQAANRGSLQAFITPWIRQLEAQPSARTVRWSLDVDPMEMY